MPQNAIPARPGDLVAYAYAIQYVCGLGKSYLECMMNGDHCKGFRYMMTIPQMFGIDFEPIRYLVKYGCKDIDILSSNISCMIDQIHTTAFRQCYLQMLYTAGSVPEKPYEIVSCEIYQGTSVCLNKVVPVPCGQEIADYFVRWSPAMFRLDKGCGSWMVSSASSIEKITTLILIQLSIALKFLLKD
ncbi:hypothetical protein ACJMK2_018217 [Sinanodonta woodiana]|uniref:Uncharacterized protein n=1 Tax=Sinanodonta woodiana TaxID=1069815 RepID=A0ABD3UG00_SINWO